MAEFRVQLEGLLDDAVRGAVAADPETVWRRGRRRRARAAGGGLLAAAALAMAGIVWLPGVVDRQPATATSAGQAVPALTPPAVHPAGLAVTIERPPAGVPASYVLRISCRRDAVAGLMEVVAEGGSNGTTGRPDTVVQPFRVDDDPDLIQGGPRAAISVEDGDSLRNTYLVVEVPEANLRLDRPDGSSGSIIGPWKLISVDARTGAAGGVRTDRPAGVDRAAVSWRCPTPRG